MNKTQAQLADVKRELGIRGDAPTQDQQEHLARYLQKVVSAQGRPPRDGSYDLASLGLGSPAPLETLASRALEGSATTQLKTLRALRESTRPILAAESKRLARIPRREAGVLRARISGVVSLGPNKRDLIVTPARGAKPPAWWHPVDPWPMSQHHKVDAGMHVEVRPGSTVREGAVLARAPSTAVCMGVRKPGRPGSIGEARTVTLPEPMAEGYQKLADYPGASSDEEVVVRYILDHKAKASGYVQDVGEDAARQRLEEGDILGLFRDLKAGGFKAKVKRKMSKWDAIQYAQRIVDFLRGKGVEPGAPALKKWSGLQAAWSALPADAVVEVPSSRQLPDVEVDAWRWDGADWVCARGASIQYREPPSTKARPRALGPIGLQTAVARAVRAEGLVTVAFTDKDGVHQELVYKPEHFAYRGGETYLIVVDDQGARASIPVRRITQIREHKVEAPRVAYPWAVQVRSAEAETLLAEPTATLQSSAKPPEGFSGRVYLWDQDKRGFIGSVAFDSADQTAEGKWLWLFRDPEPYGFLFREGGFKPVKGSWPAGQWFIDPEVAADPPNVAGIRKAQRQERVASLADTLLEGPLGQPTSIAEELNTLIRMVSSDTHSMAAIRKRFASLKSRLEAKTNPRRRLRRLTPRSRRY